MSCLMPMSEVKRHRKKKSIWIVLNNEVYDVSKFLDEHPGGEDTILEWAGQDATQAFEDAGHSTDARSMLPKYHIGTLPADERKILLAPCVGSAKSDKSWRTYDGSPSRSRSKIVPPKESKMIPKNTARVNTIVVPRERYTKVYPPPPEEPPPPRSSGKWKWILLAIATALLIGVVAKKKMSA